MSQVIPLKGIKLDEDTSNNNVPDKKQKTQQVTCMLSSDTCEVKRMCKLLYYHYIDSP
jgi:hypothetical protein